MPEGIQIADQSKTRAGQFARVFVNLIKGNFA
jgi:hypothetical protein